MLFRDSQVLNIYGIQLFLPRTKEKTNAAAVRIGSRQSMPAHAQLIPLFFGSHLPCLICIGQLSFFAFLLTSPTLLLPFCCLRMPSSRGEAYLRRLGGKGRLRHIVLSLTVSVTLSPLSPSVTPSLSSLPQSSLSPSLVSAAVQALPTPRTFPPSALPTSTIVTVSSSAVPDTDICAPVCATSLLSTRSGSDFVVSSMQSQASATVVKGDVHPNAGAFPPSARALRPSASPRLPVGQGHTIPVTSAGLVLETSTPWGEPPHPALHPVYAPLAGLTGTWGATAFGTPPFPGVVASRPLAFPGPRYPAPGPGFPQQPNFAAWGGPTHTHRAPAPHPPAGASALPDMQALSQLVAHQVAQQLWGSHHPPPCRPPAYPPVPVTSHTGQVLGQGPLAPMPSTPPPVPGVVSSGQESGQVSLPPVPPPSPPVPGIVSQESRSRSPFRSSSPVLELELEVGEQESEVGEFDSQSERFAADPQQSGSLLKSLAMLTDLCPSLAAPVTPVAEQGLSAAETLLGSQAPTPPSKVRLKESAMVSCALRSAQEAARGTGQQEDVPPEGVPDFPKALPLGKFLKPTNSPFSRRAVLAHEAIPLSALPPSQEDLLLLPVRSCSSPRACQLPDKVMANWEEMARQGLETASVMDGFLGGLTEAVRDPDPSLQGFRLRPEMDPGQICAFTRSVT